MIRYSKDDFLTLSIEKKINLISEDLSYGVAYAKHLSEYDLCEIIKKIGLEKVAIILKEIDSPSDEVQKEAIKKQACNYLKEISEKNQKMLIQKTILSGVHSVKCFSDIYFSSDCQQLLFSYFKEDVLNMYKLDGDVQRRIVKESPNSLFLIYRKFLNIDPSIDNYVSNIIKKDHFLIVEDHFSGINGFKTKKVIQMTENDIVNRIRSSPSFIYSVIRPNEKMIKIAFSHDVSTLMLLKDELVSYNSKGISDNIAAHLIRSNIKAKETYLNLIRNELSPSIESKIIQYNPDYFYSIRNPSCFIKDFFIKIKTVIPKGKNFLSKL